MAVDISMAGANITINGGGLKVENIYEFSDEANPIEIASHQVADSNMNMNGVLVTWTKASAVNVSFSLVPGSPSDKKLKAFLQAVHIGGKNGKLTKEAFIQSMVISVPLTNNSGSGLTNKKSVATFTFTEGRLMEGSAAYGSNSDGKMTPSTYTFVFEGYQTSL